MTKITKSKKGEFVPRIIVFAISGMIFTHLGKYIGSFFSSDELMVAFSGLMLIIGIISWLKTKSIKEELAVSHEGEVLVFKDYVFIIIAEFEHH